MYLAGGETTLLMLMTGRLAGIGLVTVKDGGGEDNLALLLVEMLVLLHELCGGKAELCTVDSLVPTSMV